MTGPQLVAGSLPRGLRRYSWRRMFQQTHTSVPSASQFWKGATSSWEVWHWRKCWAHSSIKPVRRPFETAPVVPTSLESWNTSNLQKESFWDFTGGWVGKSQVKLNVLEKKNSLKNMKWDCKGRWTKILRMPFWPQAHTVRNSFFYPPTQTQKGTGEVWHWRKCWAHSSIKPVRRPFETAPVVPTSLESWNTSNLQKESFWDFTGGWVGKSQVKLNVIEFKLWNIYAIENCQFCFSDFGIQSAGRDLHLQSWIFRKGPRYFHIFDVHSHMHHWMITYFYSCGCVFTGS